jgi:hypothetical protein
VQILTIDDLLDGGGIRMPAASGTFKQAERVKPAGDAEQKPLL